MSPNGPSIIIRGTGTCVPEKRLANDDLPPELETSDEWIRTRTGIEARHIAAENQHASDLGADAAKKAMADAGVTSEDIDLIIVGTMSPDFPFPATACLIQHKLGMGHIAAFDVHAACSGFVYILEVGTRMMQSGAYKNALIIGCEKMSGIVNWEDRSTCVLFGDGAGAVVLSRSEQEGVGIIGSTLAADGEHPEHLFTPAGGTQEPVTNDNVDARRNFLHMNGREIFKVAVRRMADVCQRTLEAHGVSKDEIACVVPHQANTRILDSLAKHLDLSIDRFFLNIHNYGNTSAASIPLALHEAREAGRIKPGDYVLMAAFGGGLTWGATLIKWHN